MKKIANYYRRYGHYLYFALTIIYMLFSVISLAMGLDKLWAAVILFISAPLIPGVLFVKFNQSLETALLLRALENNKEKENQ